ncbi:DMT family transporter [Clostridiaceae bacterium OttesenSCG-928-D20]|nr:DMT family transporter [Clostridiaceae bacterium OttesenSCG-928-D20]
MNELKSNNRLKGRLSLFITTLMWGSSFVVLKNTLDSITTLYVLAFRFTIAAVIFFFVAFEELKKLDKKALLGGVIMGAALFCAYVVQTFGLVYTSPGKNAFLTTAQCLIVPFLFWAMGGKRPDRFNIIAAVMCLVGIGLVSLDGDLKMGIGELLTVLSGFFYALHIVITSQTIEGRSIPALIFVQFAVVAALSWVFAIPLEPFPTNIPPSALYGIGYLSIGCTAVCFLFQTIGQKYTPPSEASVLLTMESVFGVIISMLFYKEVLTLRLFLGFAIMFSAVLISETKLSFLRRKKLEAEAGV